jgi:drug/metabolite transporter (DMT)-like permease
MAQCGSHEALSSWQVFRISRRKLTILLFSFCCFISLSMAFLALYLFGNPDHYPPVPPEAAHALIVIMLGFLVSAILLSMSIWVTMKNRVVIVTIQKERLSSDAETPQSVLRRAW